jgi:hypothetical protein
MKTTFKVLGAIMAMGVVILFGLHLFLQFGLTNAMRKVVLPRIKAETGIDAGVGRLSLNIPGGVLYLKEVAIRNPDGFMLENLASVDRIRVELDILSLFKKSPVRVKNIEVENALLNVIRNRNGDINLQQLAAGMPAPGHPAAVAEPAPRQPAVPEREAKTVRPAPEKPLPELLIETLSSDAAIRYLDFRFDQLDVSLDLKVSGSGLSTLRDSSMPWGEVAIIGSLGNDRTRFVTDLRLRLAPLTDPQRLSFDLKGKVMEIDPRIMEEVYSRLGIRSAPFGLEPALYCRAGRFEDSAIALHVRDIELEDKLADRLGGTASIDALRFTVPVKGSLHDPEFDVQSALAAAIGGNAQSLLDAFIKGTATREAGLEETPETLTDAAVEVFGSKVNEIGENEELKEELKNLGRQLFGQ